jgi:hypothetical protein
MSEDELIHGFDGLRLLSGNEVYIGIGAATDAVEWFRQRSMVILGMEGFTTDGRALQPLLDYITDFSSLSGSPDERIAASAEAAVRILRDWSHGPEFVNFVVDEAD